MIVYEEQQVSKEAIKYYCQQFIAETSYDIAIMELHRLLHCPYDILPEVIEETIKEITFYWDKHLKEMENEDACDIKIKRS